MQQRQLQLTCVMTYLLYVYYIVLILMSSGLLIWLVTIVENLPEEGGNEISFVKILGASVSSGVIGASCCYVRKLYRDGMQDKLIVSASRTTYCYHTLFYYSFRPIFAAVSSFFIVIAIDQGFFLLSQTKEIDYKNFFYLCSFLSFLVGFNISKMFSFFNKEIIKI